MEMAGSGFLAVFGVIAVLALVSTIVWVWTLVDVLRRPDQQYAAAGQTKVVWLIVVFFGHVIGVLLWLLVARPQLQRVATPRW